jgi:hypothetical protein
MFCFTFVSASGYCGATSTGELDLLAGARKASSTACEPLLAALFSQIFGESCYFTVLSYCTMFSRTSVVPCALLLLLLAVTLTIAGCWIGATLSVVVRKEVGTISTCACGARNIRQI